MEFTEIMAGCAINRPSLSMSPTILKCMETIFPHSYVICSH